jgi:hypothetical protein
MKTNMKCVLENSITNCSFKSPLPFSSPLKSESVSESESSSRLGSLFVPIGGNGLEDVGN